MRGPFEFNESSIKSNVPTEPGVYLLTHEKDPVTAGEFDNIQRHLLGILIPAGTTRSTGRGTPVSEFHYETLFGGEQARADALREIEQRFGWT